MREGLLAEFATAEALLDALRAVHGRGYRRIDAYAPFPLPAAEPLLVPHRSRLPLIIGAVGLAAAAGAYGLQWLLSVYLYPIDVGARPLHMPLPFLLISFEMGVLFAALSAFFGVLVVAGATRLWHPVFEVEGFERASIDRFFLEIDAGDPLFDERDTAAQLADTGALRVVRVGGEA
ncbi:DUF3341 domain-containing protein [Haliangium ochraceum]|uniref:Quinol:cytochrome c oxidoreductase membrane protein n=1 Tax=Haliangium ochraceum (strain DSM 14365 / JCM 11303 / SMP-2) TaxID=502025 RepID=D0LN63_HALO1|nr:DUF3341 domain-containing protein [Haliangium ochraceum]ACY15240.1 conserved hypothetical protein [Haliangium ochraceum DSM 14365]